LIYRRASAAHVILFLIMASPDDHRFLFIGGMHRSGTSLVTNLVGHHPQASRMLGTDEFEDEGQHVQHVYERGNQHGGPGRFAFSPAMHLTESSPLVSPASAEQLWQDWSPYWDLSREVLVEKSPPNLLKSRFLQGLFPGASFVMVLRHPIAVAMATTKWSHTTWPRLIEHWLVAHETMLEDLPHLERVIVVRYEDLMLDPAAEFRRITDLMSLPPASVDVEIRHGVNDAYLHKWERNWPWARLGRNSSIRRYAERVQRFGYDLTPPYDLGLSPAQLLGR
jgi:hypothetical protein